MKSLVGYTGFVGSNLWNSSKYDKGYNSKNIWEAFGTKPDLLVYAGLRAEKFLANTQPEQDLQQIEEAKNNIQKIDPKRLVLISTVDVYKIPCAVDENSLIDVDELQPYGYHRFLLEKWVRQNYPNALIIRLPGLYGRGIKKNFIYDYIHMIPSMLKESKMEELCKRNKTLENFYVLQKNGFYACKKLSREEQHELKKIFSELGFSALNFTDSRSSFQFYPLSRLQEDIEIAIEKNISLWNPATQPVTAAELYKYLCGQEFVNEISDTPANYNYRTCYAKIFGAEESYIMSKEEVLKDIKKFVGGIADEISHI